MNLASRLPSAPFRAHISLTRMSRRAQSTSPSPEPRAVKRARLDERALTPDDYKNGVMLAPMVRSGALPTRLFALKHGAKLVWGPEIIDKAILHAERVVDPVSGAISYHGKSKAMFTTHPIEKPYYIFQIGSADPALAVQAARVVQDDVAGIDLNCGCPKPFSTHAGMGAALLSTPDLLCDILRALRAALPPRISLSAKIRLLPNQADTLKLVEQIIGTGVNALTVHCRTRNQRMREPAVIHRLQEIVHFVEGLGKGTAVIANGDCQNFEDAKRVKEISHAHSVMIATAAESNPTVFSPTPLIDVERTLIPAYIRLSKYLDNHWSSTKWCIAQYKAPHPGMTKSEHKTARDAIQHAKEYEDLEALAGGPDALANGGKAEFDEIRAVLAERERHAEEDTPTTVFEAALQEDTPLEDVSPEDLARVEKMLTSSEPPQEAAPINMADATTDNGSLGDTVSLSTGTPSRAKTVTDGPVTPSAPRPNPEAPGSWAPLLPATALSAANLLEQGKETPTPGGSVSLPIDV